MSVESVYCQIMQTQQKLRDINMQLNFCMTYRQRQALIARRYRLCMRLRELQHRYRLELVKANQRATFEARKAYMTANKPKRMRKQY